MGSHLRQYSHPRLGFAGAYWRLVVQGAMCWGPRSLVWLLNLLWMLAEFWEPPSQVCLNISCQGSPWSWQLYHSAHTLRLLCRLLHW